MADKFLDRFGGLLPKRLLCGLCKKKVKDIKWHRDNECHTVIQVFHVETDGQARLIACHWRNCLHYTVQAGGYGQIN